MPLDQVSPSVSSAATLADVIATIYANIEIQSRRREELISAIRTCATVLGREPQHIAADPGALRRRMREIGPTVAGLSPGRWRNVRSLVMAALAVAGIAVERLR